VRITIVAVASVLVASCQTIVLDGEIVTDRTVGIITNGYSAQVIKAPDTVSANQSFEITVYSFGSSSCTIPDHVDLDISGLRATITPHDRSSGQFTCTSDIAARPHPVQLRFGHPGIATIHVIGTVFNDAGESVTGSAYHTIVVRP
jgi:hypothetical protein